MARVTAAVVLGVAWLLVGPALALVFIGGCATTCVSALVDLAAWISTDDQQRSEVNE